MYTMNKKDFDGADEVCTFENLILNKESEVKYRSGHIDSLEMSVLQGEPIEMNDVKIKTSDSDCDDVIGILSQKEVVNFTEENSLMIGYKND